MLTWLAHALRSRSAVSDNTVLVALIPIDFGTEPYPPGPPR